jgi:hypothetical protein
MPEYEHVQKGIIQPILLASGLICLGISVFMRETTFHIIIFLTTAVVCVILSFAYAFLTVRDEGDCLSVRFGPLPLFRKFIPYTAITAVDKDRSNFISGWGIHPTKKGWLWNIGGLDCVRIEMGKKSILIGTDDPDGLTAFLRSKAG